MLDTKMLAAGSVVIVGVFTDYVQEKGLGFGEVRAEGDRSFGAAWSSIVRRALTAPGASGPQKRWRENSPVSVRLSRRPRPRAPEAGTGVIRISISPAAYHAI